MGKGSKIRPFDVKKYRENFDEIDWFKKPQFITPDAIDTDLTTKIKVIKTPKGKAKRYVYR